jgi:hypothetical protein
MQQTYKGRMDTLSIFISGLCIIHCIILPLFVSTLSILSIEVLENPWLELITVLLALLIGGAAIFRGYFKFHRKQTVLWLFVIGITLMMIANTMEESKEAFIKVVGAVMITFGHIRNYRLSRRYSVCCN